MQDGVRERARVRQDMLAEVTRRDELRRKKIAVALRILELLVRNPCGPAHERSAEHCPQQPQIRHGDGRRRFGMLRVGFDHPPRGGVGRIERALEVSPRPVVLRAECGHRADERTHLGDHGERRRAFFERHFAPDEIVRLNAGRALVYRGDARIAEVLRRAAFFDEAHAAVDLHARRGDLDRLLRAPSLHDGRQEIEQRLLAALLSGSG